MGISEIMSGGSRGSTQHYLHSAGAPKPELPRAGAAPCPSLLASAGMALVQWEALAQQWWCIPHLSAWAMLLLMARMEGFPIAGHSTCGRRSVERECTAAMETAKSSYKIRPDVTCYMRIHLGFNYTNSIFLCIHSNLNYFRARSHR